ncbi:MAG TPA: TolC family protein [Planctomycetota bacterium]|jgi:outer membrane protein, heavy metal efflux system|nr:TolC family protein [Planctomycetota bacterium]
MRGGWLALAVLASSGCAHPEPRPLDPAASEAEFRARSLSEPGLRTFVEAGLPARPFPPKEWDLAALTLAAFYFHPELEVARSRLRVAEAGAVTAGARPNPTLSFGPEYTLNAAAGVSPWILGLTLDVPLEIAGKRGYRIEGAEKRVEAARMELAETGWAIRSRVRAALAAHVFAQREVELVGAERGLRGEAVALLERLRAAGEVSRPDVEEGRLEFNTAAMAMRAAEGRSLESLASLAASIGIPMKAIEGITLSWPNLETPPGLEAIPPADLQKTALLGRADLRRLLAEYAAAEAGLQLEVAKRYPDVHLGPGFLWDQGDNKIALGLSFELPLFNRNEGPIAEAEARRQETAARFLALQAEVIGATDLVQARFRSAHLELTEAEGLLAAIDRRERVAQQAVKLGQEDRLALVSVQVRKAVAGRSRLEALRKVHEAFGALEDAAQMPLSGSATVPPAPRENPRGANRKENSP